MSPHDGFSEEACTGKHLARLVQPAVLRVLATEPLHGYLIVQRLTAMRMFQGQPPNPAGVYRMLHTMESDGLVTASWDLGGAGPAKRCFRLTPRGAACLAQWAATLEEYRDAITDLLGDIRNTRRQMARDSSRGGVQASYRVGETEVDSLDLKVLLLTQGLFVREEVYRTFGETSRISPDPVECSLLYLPDQTVVHIANIGAQAPFHLAVGPDARPVLLHHDQLVTEVLLPRASNFYRQQTARGVPFRGMAVLQGHDVLSFPYLWPCEFARVGQACQFCHCGYYTQHQIATGVPPETVFTPQDVAEAVHFAVNVEHSAKFVQLTGGSSPEVATELRGLVDLLRALGAAADLRSLGGETIVYASPPEDPPAIEALFAAGADRVACDLEIWDEELARRICPGKYSRGARQRHLATLEHMARKFGPGKACSTFVVGLESAESFLAGAEYLACRGIVPIPSVWMAHGLPPIAGITPPPLAFFRQVSQGLAGLYRKYQCQPPGAVGFNVCLCRDTWNHLDNLVAAPLRQSHI